MNRQYAQARSTLLTYRYATNGRTAQVDYMLATASCRLPAHRQWGGNLLQHILHRYPLPPPSRQIILSESALCRSAAAMPVLSSHSLQVGISAVAGARGRGKGGYFLNTNTPNVVFQAVSADPLSEDVLQRRLVPIGDRNAIMAVLAATTPPGARAAVRGRYAFVTTGGHSDRQLRSIERRLDRFLRFLEQEYGLQLPDYYVTLYLVQNNDELRSQALRIHNLEVSNNAIGYAYQDDQSAIAIIPSTRIGTLLHELFHLVVRTSFGDIPQWLDEGLASLYEVSAFEDDRLVGVPNWRGPVLSRLWSSRPTLDNMIRADWFTGDAPSIVSEAETEAHRRARIADEMAVRFATQRYFALYLQETGKLQSVFQAMQRIEPGSASDPQEAAIAAVVAEMGPLAQVQTDFEAWFLRTGGRSEQRRRRELVDPAVPPERRRGRGTCSEPWVQSNC